jgi:aspartate/methionine/tyrosine aminotransferase
MTLPFSPRVRATAPSPVMEARRWVAAATFPPDRPLLNLSQAAPMDPPPEPLRAAMAEMLADPACHIYGPVLGLPDLRAEIADRWSEAYGGRIDPADVAVTPGCNMAFCAAMATLAGPGDAVLLPVPWYFNHKMWLDLQGIETIPLPCGPDMLPDIEAAARLMGPRVRAVVLVSPNNPTGAEYPAATVSAFADLARRNGAALVLDETYRDFDSRTGAPHALFADPDWRGTLVHLYSFSKAFRLTGHRVGALIAHPDRLAQAEKFLDTTSICAPQLGQRAALWGLRRLAPWVADERAEVLRRRAAVREIFDALPGWRVLGAGAYFAYVRHPFPEPSDRLAQRLVTEQSLLMLPGTMFSPEGQGRDQIRVAFANLGEAGIAEFGRRLAALTPEPVGP